MALSKKVLSDLSVAMGSRKSAKLVSGSIHTAQATDHSHANKSTLDQITAAFTSALKSTYDGYASGKEDAGVAATAVGTHETTFSHALLATSLQQNAISGDFTTVDGKTVTVVDGQITAIAGP